MSISHSHKRIITHKRILRSKSKPNDVTAANAPPKIGMIDNINANTVFTMVRANMPNQRIPKTTVDCNACHRTVRFFSRSKKKMPDIQKNI